MIVNELQNKKNLESAIIDTLRVKTWAAAAADVAPNTGYTPQGGEATKVSKLKAELKQKDNTISQLRGNRQQTPQVGG